MTTSPPSTAAPPAKIALNSFAARLPPPVATGWGGATELAEVDDSAYVNNYKLTTFADILILGNPIDRYSSFGLIALRYLLKAVDISVQDPFQRMHYIQEIFDSLSHLIKDKDEKKLGLCISKILETLSPSQKGEAYVPFFILLKEAAAIAKPEEFWQPLNALGRFSVLLDKERQHWATIKNYDDLSVILIEMFSVIGRSDMKELISKERQLLDSYVDLIKSNLASLKSLSRLKLSQKQNIASFFHRKCTELFFANKNLKIYGSLLKRKCMDSTLQFFNFEEVKKISEGAPQEDDISALFAKGRELEADYKDSLQEFAQQAAEMVSALRELCVPLQKTAFFLRIFPLYLQLADLSPFETLQDCFMTQREFDGFMEQQLDKFNEEYISMQQEPLTLGKVLKIFRSDPSIKLCYEVFNKKGELFSIFNSFLGAYLDKLLDQCTPLIFPSPASSTKHKRLPYRNNLKNRDFDKEALKKQTELPSEVSEEENIVVEASLDFAHFCTPPPGVEALRRNFNSREGIFKPIPRIKITPKSLSILDSGHNMYKVEASEHVPEVAREKKISALSPFDLLESFEKSYLKRYEKLFANKQQSKIKQELNSSKDHLEDFLVSVSRFLRLFRTEDVYCILTKMQLLTGISDLISHGTLCDEQLLKVIALSQAEDEDTVTELNQLPHDTVIRAHYCSLTGIASDSKIRKAIRCTNYGELSSRLLVPRAEERAISSKLHTAQDLLFNVYWWSIDKPSRNLSEILKATVRYIKDRLLVVDALIHTLEEGSEKDEDNFAEQCHVLKELLLQEIKNVEIVETPADALPPDIREKFIRLQSIMTQLLAKKDLPVTVSIHFKNILKNLLVRLETEWTNYQALSLKELRLHYASSLLLAQYIAEEFLYQLLELREIYVDKKAIDHNLLSLVNHLKYKATQFTAQELAFLKKGKSVRSHMRYRIEGPQSGSSNLEKKRQRKAKSIQKADIFNHAEIIKKVTKLLYASPLERDKPLEGFTLSKKREKKRSEIVQQVQGEMRTDLETLDTLITKLSKWEFNF